MQGAGVGGSGAIINNNNNGGGYLTNVTLAGDTTLGGSARSDLSVKLSTGGQPYSVTIVGGAYHEWDNLSADASLSNVTVGGSAVLGYKGTTTLGGSSGTLSVLSGAGLVFYNDAVSPTLAKPLVLNDGSILQNGGGAATITGPVVLTNSGVTANCYFDVGGTSLTINGALSGDGTLNQFADTSPLILNGNSPCSRAASSSRLARWCSTAPLVAASPTRTSASWKARERPTVRWTFPAGCCRAQRTARER